ncbi:MAG: transcription-repair coupling factor, partial [Clostridia bacterium]|nr:transcription-repair coupling factor [Clostridia bacterium]
VKKDAFLENVVNFKVGNTYNLENVVAGFINAGYKRVDAVEQVGEFSVRGDLIDIFAPNHSQPIRINFFDDEIETIIYYDNVNLTRIKNFDEVFICPNSLMCVKNSERADFEKKVEALKNSYSYETAIQSLSNDNFPVELLNILDVKTFNLYDYLDNPTIIYQNYLTLNSKFEKYKDELERRLSVVFKDEDLITKIKRSLKISLVNDSYNSIYFDNAVALYSNSKHINAKSKNLNNYLRNIGLIKSDFSNDELKNKTIKLCLADDYSLKSIKEVFVNLGINFSTQDTAKGFVLTTEKIPYNICLDSEDVWWIGSSNFAHKKEIKTGATKKISFLPKSGEYVVHEVHGIGLCEGIVTLKVMGADKDFFKIAYAKGDILYVPTENTNSLSLYMGSADAKLNKLGGKEFALTKQRTEKAIEEMAKDLLELYAKRSQAKGFKYSEDNYLMTEFENSFEFNETIDQAQAIIDIKRDMTSGKVMDRLICGDVGYGKTEVAIRACFKAFLDGKQIAVLAPTTILSLQHFMSFSKRFKDFGVRIEMLNRFKTNKEKEDIIKKLKNGEIDVVCGTHSLLAEGVDFKDLGLLILDEEQRFGVKAKEKLKNLKNNVGVIAMSATPIPRTLNMALLSLRDISIINTPPQNRLPVKTYVCPFDLDICAQAVKKEIDRNGQVLIVYNDIEKIYGFASNLMQKVNDERCRFDVAHGKMTRVELENAIKRLYDGKTNVFISTTLIENGVDLPSANTLIVLNSQNLGLSQMYQLRGRVGRSDEQAYAYFTYPAGKTITIEATNRLEALAENTELGSGFKIAMRDLQLRGAGELLGKEQHGHMIKVGYDMYVKLLEETVQRLNGENIIVNKEVKIDIGINAKIPSYFVENEQEKLKIYSKISNISSVETQKEIVAELKSGYGKLPKEVLQLTNVALIKALAQKVGVKRVVIEKNNYSIIYYKEDFNADKVLEILSKFPKIRLVKAELPTIKLNTNEFSPETAQGYFIEFLNSQI